MYFGAPFSAPSSIKSKSNTKFSEAIITTTKLNPILISEPLVGFITENPAPKKLATNENKYTNAIPPVAANTPNLKFSVALINPDLYAKSNESKMETVIIIALNTIPSYN